MEDWKKSYIFGTLVICPPKKVCSIVDALRAKYDPLSQAIMGAHITLTQPFLKEPTPQVWKEINKILSEFEIFPITYGPIETFPNSSVIKFKIQQQSQILSLRNKLHQTGYFNLELLIKNCPNLQRIQYEKPIHSIQINFEPTKEL